MKTVIVTVGVNIPEVSKQYVEHRLQDEDYHNKLRAKVDYVQKCRRMVKQYHKHTDFDILVITNNEQAFENIGQRVKTIHYDQSQADVEYLKSFNENVKLDAIGEAYKLGYDVVYWIDGDSGTVGWDQRSWDQLIGDKRFDVWGNSPIWNRRLHRYSFSKRSYNYHVCSVLEDRLIFTSREQLGYMIDLWNNDKLWDTLFKHDKWRGFGGCCSVMIGEALKYSGSRYTETKGHKFAFADYERVYNKRNDILTDRYWNRC